MEGEGLQHQVLWQLRLLDAQLAGVLQLELVLLSDDVLQQADVGVAFLLGQTEVIVPVGQQPRQPQVLQGFGEFVIHAWAPVVVPGTRPAPARPAGARREKSRAALSKAILVALPLPQAFIDEGIGQPYAFLVEQQDGDPLQCRRVGDAKMQSAGHDPLKEIRDGLAPKREKSADQPMPFDAQ